MNAKNWWQSKTVWAGVAAVATAAGAAFAGEESWMAAVMAGFGLVQVILRFKTSAPVTVGKRADVSDIRVR